MDFLYLIIACIFFSAQFLFQKNFQKNAQGGFAVSLWNQFVVSFCMSVFLAIQVHRLAANGIVLLYSLLYAVSSLTSSISSLFALRYGKVSVVSNVCLAGGMVLPFLYGIFFANESVTVCKLLGILFLCASLVPSLLDKNNTKTAHNTADSMKYLLFCLLVFCGNGFVSIFSKLQATHANVKSDSDTYVLLNALVMLTVTTVGMCIFTMIRRIRGEKHAVRKTFYEIGKTAMNGKLFVLLITMTAGFALCNGLGNIFSLRCAQTMDSSLQFPLLSGIVIFLTAVLGWLFFKERIGKRTLVSLTLTLIGITLFIIPA